MWYNGIMHRRELISESIACRTYEVVPEMLREAVRLGKLSVVVRNGRRYYDPKQTDDWYDRSGLEAEADVRYRRRVEKFYRDIPHLDPEVDPPF